MKRNLLKTLFAGLFLSMLTPMTASADEILINTTNFPDANFRNWLLAQDYGQDGKITDEEIKSITKIGVSSKNISSLQGIEHFTALEELSCGSNQLTSLDVSKNTRLQNLYCSFSQLTSLDVSKNTALTRLQCHLNQLTSLDVSKNTALTQLYCHSNQLTSLDVSKNTALEWFNCYDNQLTSLDVSKNTALQDLSCYSNQLTSLDVSKNTRLELFNCSSNQLTSLDVSKNTRLRSLWCYSNQLTSLDVSQNTALTYLDCSINQIKGTAMDALIESLPVNTRFWYCSLNIYSSRGADGNVCTRSQVAAIKAKGWTPYYTTDGQEWIEYEGNDADIISVGAAGIATYCSPFDLNFDSDDLKAYIASGYDQATCTVLLTRVKEVPAGTGIILMGSEGTHEVSIQPTQYYYVNMLKGTLTAQPVPQTEGGYTNYILANGSEGVKFYMSSGNGSIAAFKAYLQVPTSALLAAARRVLNYAFEDNETTGIHQTQGTQQQDGVVYNLNGQRVEQPRKGLYIKNGKKVFIH